MFYGFTTQYPTSPNLGATQSLPEGASFQQRQMLEQAQSRLQSSTPGTPQYERTKNYLDRLLKSFQPAPTRPVIGGQPTAADLDKQIEYQKQLNQWRRERDLFSGVEQGGPAYVAESARRGAAYQQLLYGRDAYARAESDAARIAQSMSGPYARQQNQIAAMRADYNNILQTLQRGSQQTLSDQMQQANDRYLRMIRDAETNARMQADRMFSDSDKKILEAEERIKQSYASRGMYGSSAMNDEIAKIKSEYEDQKNKYYGQIIDEYRGQARAKFENEQRMASQAATLERNRLRSKLAEYQRIFNEYTRSGAATRPPSYEEIVNQLYRQYQPPAVDWSQYNPFYYGGYS